MRDAERLKIKKAKWRCFPKKPKRIGIKKRLYLEQSKIISIERRSYYKKLGIRDTNTNRDLFLLYILSIFKRLLLLLSVLLEFILFLLATIFIEANKGLLFIDLIRIRH